VNVSSTYGHTGAAEASRYAASKHAVEGLTKSAALEAASSGVRVNIVAWGPIETGMLNRFTGTDERKAGLAATVPLKRTGRPEEIAQTIMFSRRTRRRSSRVRRTSWTAARQPSK
jgi:NAD(P)-dependent dehydrogenase (short-subunit alcohol dehydrogenase family)